ncbi:MULTISPECIES: helix-turn-helix transcriptional regulator [Parafrankia]|nr:MULTISPECIES: helix-turn-helix transcriptional regulator [Parafrankia]
MSGTADEKNTLGQFLRARREQVGPASLGLPDHGRRRVRGLRREELALLAGMSVDYYVRLEQGRDQNPSEHVLDALATVLRLDDAETAHRHQLGRPRPHRRRALPRVERVSPALLSLLSLWPNTPALVLGRRTDVLAANILAAALSPGFGRGQNLVRSVFLDPGSRETFPDWERIAADCVASLRGAAVDDLNDPLLTELVGELSLKSETFRQLWARHHVRERASGTKRFAHPLVGELTLRYESFGVNSAPGQVLVVHHTAHGSADEQALALLSSLVAGSTPADRPGRRHLGRDPSVPPAAGGRASA